MLAIKKTDAFAVLEYVSECSERNGAYIETEPHFVSGLLRNGAFLCGSQFFQETKLKETRKSIEKLVKYLISSYDSTSDEFSELDIDHWNIVRSPRINPGKHNIHFDPFLSEHHAALADMASSSCLSDLLTEYQYKLEVSRLEKDFDGNNSDNDMTRKTCSLRETGLSLTAPVKGKLNVNSNQSLFGNGMELHSDGCRGENTVLLSFDDISFEQGPLLVSPGSHHDYVDGIGHAPENLLRTIESVLNNQSPDVSMDKVVNNVRHVLHYSYAAGNPMVIDARTLHGALPNSSDSWRVICWFIYEYI